MAELDATDRMEVLISAEIMLALCEEPVREAFDKMLLAAGMDQEEGKVALQLEWQGVWTKAKLAEKGIDVFPDFRFEGETLWLIEPVPDGFVTREEFVHWSGGLYVSLMAHNEYQIPGEMFAKALIIRG